MVNLCNLVYREEVHKEASLLLVGDWVTCAVPSLVDEIVFGLLPRFILQRKSQKTAIRLSLTVSKSVLAAHHPLLSAMKEFVKNKGTVHKTFISEFQFFPFLQVISLLPYRRRYMQ